MKVKTHEEMQKLKLLEIRSFIVCELSNQGAPSWVRPAMIWEERWNRADYTAERAKKEAREKIKVFVPLCAKDIHNDHLESIYRRAI